MNVSLHQLKVFVAVARERSFTRAARELGLTQSAVSRCVRELEDAINLRLFDRTTRQVELTSAGAGFERRIGRLLDEIDLALCEGRSSGHAYTGVVVIGSNTVLSSGWVPDGVAQCAAAFPELTVQIRDLPQAAVLPAVEQSEVDFCILSDALPCGSASLEMQPLFTTPLCAVLPADHVLAQGEALGWCDLERTPIVTLNQDACGHRAIARALGVRAADVAPVQEFGHIASVLRMVELGLGVGVLPVGAHWPAPHASLVVRVLQPVAALTTMLVRRKNRSLSPNAQAVWQQLASYAAVTPLPDRPAAIASVSTSARDSLCDTGTRERGPSALPHDIAWTMPVSARVA